MSQSNDGVIDYLKALAFLLVISGGTPLLGIISSAWVTLGKKLGDLFSRETEDP